ncbi:ribokinase [Erysipelothrix sp. HDW6C]|uniref:ribokinase n=1 Tax=Erysipelothrix sp. HDW6C TaxID=2714930 RepID=UPI00140BF939|nr:ribokinase [Erysipelothrix sp. HDW6C]QIK69635.1 ribokinase [Erysipelothrix sp. HDW6C]
MSKIVVIGSINEDTSLRVHHFPTEGETIIADAVSINNGGKGANQAVAAARLGGSVAMIGAVGIDGSGRRMIADFQGEGIDTQGIIQKQDQTGFAIINVDQQGHNNIVVYPGANHAISKEDIDAHRHLIKDADYCLIQFEIPMAVIEYAIMVCREYEVKVVLNPAPYSSSFNPQVLKDVAYFVPNEHEFASSIGSNIDFNTVDEFELKKVAESFVTEYQCNLIVTLGVRGSLLATPTKFVVVDAIQTQAVDTTAAGDTYIGALTSQLSQSIDIDEAMKYASKAAALTVSKMGAQTSIPYKKDLT